MDKHMLQGQTVPEVLQQHQVVVTVIPLPIKHEVRTCENDANNKRNKQAKK